MPTASSATDAAGRRTASFSVVKTTAAPHYRRILLEHKKESGTKPRHGVFGGLGERVNDGRGFLFVSHLGDIYRLQAAFHRAKSTQDIDLMMALWHPDGTLNVQGDPNAPYVGFDRLKAFWLTSGSFVNRRFSLVPSFKIQIELRGSRLVARRICFGNLAGP